jgi:maleate isomerase
MKGWRGRLGFLVPPGCPTVEPEMQAMAPEGVSVHFSRMIAQGQTGTMEGLGDRIRTCVEQIDGPIDLLAMTKPRVIVLGFTAASYYLGREREAALAQRTRASTGIPLISAFGSAVAALEELGVRKVALGTPYGEELTQQARSALQENGLEVVSHGRLHGVSNIYDETEERAYQLARSVDREDAQAIFISGVGLPTVSVLETLEKDLGKPVISASSSMMWNALRTAGISTSVPGYGRLFR